MAEGEGGHEASICLSAVSPKKWAKSAGSSGVSPRSSVRSKQTCFLAGTWGEHSVTDPGMELGHPVVCVSALSGHILLTTSPWIPTAGAADEVCLKSGAIAFPCSVAQWAWRWQGMTVGSCGSLGRCLS